MDTLDSFPNLSQPREVKVNDYIADFLLESNQECFKICVKDFKNQEMTKSEVECLNTCYSKYFSSFLNVSERINKNV